MGGLMNATARHTGASRRRDSSQARPYQKILLGLLTALVQLCGPAAQAQETPPSEYQLKAAFLYNFAKFVEWPPEAFPEATAPFIIGVLGDNPFGGELARTVNNKTINGHPFTVKEGKAVYELKTCHILFISKSEKKQLPEIMNVLGAASVLTVSEVDRFLRSGGMINFVMEGKKVRFEIHDEAAKRAGLRISSKLMNLARRTGREDAK